MIPIYECHVWTNYSRLEPDQYRNLQYKLCPKYDCSTIVAEMALHLRNKHNFTRARSREIAKEAKLVKDMNWTDPNIASPVACDDDDSIATHAYVFKHTC